jgi:hypothetical protein
MGIGGNMNVVTSSPMSLSSTIKSHEGISFAILKRVPDPSPAESLPSQKIQFESAPSSLIKKISSEDFQRVTMMERFEMERLLMMTVPHQLRHYPPHFSVEKGSMLDVFA